MALTALVAAYVRGDASFGTNFFNTAVDCMLFGAIMPIVTMPLADRAPHTRSVHRRRGPAVGGQWRRRGAPGTRRGVTGGPGRGGGAAHWRRRLRSGLHLAGFNTSRDLGFALVYVFL